MSLSETASTGSSSSKTHLFQGQWWFPESPENRVGGILRFDAEAGGVLTLTGGLADDLDYRFLVGPRSQTILGETKEQAQVTILEASYSRSTTRRRDEQDYAIAEEWTSFLILLGEHISEGIQAKYDSCRIETHLLPEWLNRSRVYSLENEGGVDVVRMPDLPSKEFSTGIGKLTLGWSSSNSIGRIQFRYETTPNYTFDFIDSLTYDEIWSRAISPIVHLMTFLAGQADQVRRIQLLRTRQVDKATERSNYGPEGLQSVEVLSTVGSSEGNPVRSSWHDMALTFEGVENRFGEIVNKWFLLYEEVPSIMLEMFSLSVQVKVFLEDSFSRAVRIAETWHRAQYGGFLIDKKQFKELLRRIKECCADDEWSIVKMRMQHGNEFTQNQRLDDLIDRAGEPLIDLISKYKQVKNMQFTKAVIAMRNEMTHGGKDRYSILSHHEMFWAMRTLQLVIKGAVLQKLDFDNSETSKALRTLIDRNGIGSVYNVWLDELDPAY